MTCKGLRNAISLPVSASGPTLFDWLDGPMTAPSGLEAAPASLSASPATTSALTTSDTSGPSGSTLFNSADLQRSLESKLKERCGMGGLTLFAQTWRAKATPLGRQYWAHTASVPRISVRDCGSWPTPRREDSESTGGHRGRADTLHSATQLAAWATPQSRDHKGSRTGEALYTHNSRPLNEQAAMLVPASGMPPIGSTAETAKLGQLNPAHSRWLMGLPAEWDACAPTATRSVRR